MVKFNSAGALKSGQSREMHRAHRESEKVVLSLHLLGTCPLSGKTKHKLQMGESGSFASVSHPPKSDYTSLEPKGQIGKAYFVNSIHTHTHTHTPTHICIYDQHNTFSFCFPRRKIIYVFAHQCF